MKLFQQFLDERWDNTRKTVKMVKDVFAAWATQLKLVLMRAGSLEILGKLIYILWRCIPCAHEAGFAFGADVYSRSFSTSKYTALKSTVQKFKSC